MKIYIASSWRHQHAVEMLTALLRQEGAEVFSWVENNYGENHNHVTKKFSFDDWCNSPESDQSFEYDTNGAKTCNVFIYLGPSGKDAAAECGMAYARGAIMLALSGKGEDFGLMRKMFTHWCSRYTDLITAVRYLIKSGRNNSNSFGYLAECCKRPITSGCDGSTELCIPYER